MASGSLDCEETIYQLRRIGSPATLSGVADIFKLRQDVTVIGRAREKVGFYIDSAKHQCLISRIHARIFRSRTQDGKDVFKICDTSVNGTYVNNMKISNEALLRPGDTIAFGHLEGASLQVENYYSQPYSEFLFKFESSATDYVESSQHSSPERPLEDHGYPGVNDLPDLSVFLATSTPPLSSAQSSSEGESTCTTKRELVKTLNESGDDDNENDYKMLQECASAATLAAARQSESDEDPFAIKTPDILPEGATEMLEHKEKCESPETIRPKRKMSLKTKEATSHLSQETSSDQLVDSCAAINCLRPNDKIISFVQCDKCQQWYHIKCTGLSLKLVKPKNTKFHCGCP